ncbi:MAG: tetratricopeptide repeat protein [Cypionkella sp.]
MPHFDLHGHALTGATTAAAEHFDNALSELQCYRGDPVAQINKAISAAPGFVMAHAMKGWLNLLGTEPETIPTARKCLANALAAAKGQATCREMGHIAAIEAMSGGHYLKAGRLLEDVSIENPRDALALLAGHQIDFFTGQSRQLRDRIARALPSWAEGMPGFHSILGMYAFGLEETGDYARAEAAGRRGVELEHRDGWSQHAVAHVLEMQGRHEDGVRWMEGNCDGWTGDSFLQVHNWWHLALYKLDIADFDAVLNLYDDQIGGEHAVAVVDRVDASALLWRLFLQGVDVGDRFQDLANRWAPIATAGSYAFNDFHAVMAFVGAGRDDMCKAVQSAQDDAIGRDNDNASSTRDIGRPATEALIAFGQGNFRATLDLLRPVRNTAWRFGGSHAQRDVIDLTMIESAFRLGDRALATALAAERLEAKPESPLAQFFARRAAAEMV